MKYFKHNLFLYLISTIIKFGDFMGKRTEFKCDNWWWEYIYENDLFAIDKNHGISLTPILFMTCGGMPDKPVNGDYDE